MKSISTILAALLCSTSPLLAEEPPKQAPVEETAQSEQTQQILLGKDQVSSLRKAYENGEYDSFLGELEEIYQKAVLNDELKQLSAMRSGTAPEAQQWEESAVQLQKERNQGLLSAVADEDDSVFAQKVRSVAANLSTPEQEKALSQLSKYLQMPLNSGKSADENVLIDIDLEYEFKTIHLSQTLDPSTPAAERRAKLCALRMEKMDKILSVSRAFQDASLKQAIGLAAANYDERLAQNWDAMDLVALAKGKVKPASPLEEKVASILASHQDKFNDLLKQYLDEQK